MIGTNVSAKMMATLAFRSVAKQSIARRIMRFILAAVVVAVALSLTSMEKAIGFDLDPRPSRADYVERSLNQHLRSLRKQQPSWIEMSHIEKASLTSLKRHRVEWRYSRIETRKTPEEALDSTAQTWTMSRRT